MTTGQPDSYQPFGFAWQLDDVMALAAAANERHDMHTLVTQILELARDIETGKYGQPPATALIVNKLRELAIQPGEEPDRG